MISLKILLWLFAAIPAGLLLIWLGLRGRRINRVPACRQCSFDLSGSWPASTVCPECGVGLKQSKMVVTGQRRRMWWLIVPGGLGVALAGLALASALFFTLSGRDVYKYKPVSLLLWEGRNASPEYAEAAVKELIDRMITDKITDPEIDQAMSVALEIQGNLDKPWLEEWGALIERGMLDGDLTNEQKALYRQQSGVLELVARSRVRLGDPLPIAVRLKETRVGPETNLQMCFQVNEVKYTSDGKSLPVATKGFFSTFGGESLPSQLVYAYIAGNASQYRWRRPEGVVQTRHRLRSTDKPGMVSISVESLSAEVDMTAGSMGQEPRMPTRLKKGGTGTTSNQWVTSVEIVPADGSSVELVPETEQLKKQMLWCVTVDDVLANVDPASKDSNHKIYATISYTDPKVPMAMEAFIWIAGTELKVGEFTTSEFPKERSYDSGGQGKKRTIQLSGWFEGDLPDTVDVILRPKPELAESTPDLVSIYGDELVYEKVQVTKQKRGGT